MIRWEYKFEHRLRAANLTQDEIEKLDVYWLNTHGFEGWELVLIGGDNTNVFLFKRPVVEYNPLPPRSPR